MSEPRSIELFDEQAATGSSSSVDVQGSRDLKVLLFADGTPDMTVQIRHQPNGSSNWYTLHEEVISADTDKHIDLGGGYDTIKVQVTAWTDGELTAHASWNKD